MSELKAGDLVRVVKQSTTINSHISTVGLRGFIEEIVGYVAQFQELAANGLGGCGGVPLACLEKDDSPDLRRLKEERDARHERLYQEAVARSERYNKLRREFLLRASDETGVSYRSTNRIFELAEEFDKEWEKTNGW